MSSSFVIACVGKPSAGKSSFLNAVTDATAKVGNFPFTTIEPNQGVAYYPLDCPCVKHGVTSRCKPRHGWCTNGRRFVPVRMLDVAGLVPGASEGRGLGNKFLDDLRHADVLIHVVDASGTTDDNGRETKGYDPINDIQWLRGEIDAWVFGNLERRWPGIVRRHVATKAPAVDTLHAQLGGYGTTRDIVQRAMDTVVRTSLIASKDELAQWTLDDLHVFVGVFLDHRFPTIVALNKIDMPDSGKNIASIVKRYHANVRDGVSEENIVLTSALAECFLRRMVKQNYIHYTTGDDDFVSKDDDTNMQLKEMDEKTRRRLGNIRDLVLFRYGSTGVQDVIVRAVQVLGFVPVFPVKSVTSFGASNGESPAFQDCVLVRNGTTVREFARKLHNRLDVGYAGAETVGGIQLAEDDIIVAGKNNIIKITTIGA
ncbi:hypothetical protein GGH12_002786 [Coemansia sp. RSA 1822]|nr:hypothetical protein LPJ76_002665 [Coemansia sp. RSA 638]KAJ2482700.1 hypothetical protein IWW56_000873 [Coemansia sp. RSA 2131]KAJ2545395.1 hypothetical protein GGF49_000428 [Coemansia sp. RSA 1853]KAJ2563087.1 hypothetical protein GGH12_002786 [Coemansia sp. RSA 1822]KAJ2664259.1 hypothetical protein IW148_002083 [Coemansia sp. RSA 1199]